MEKEKLKGLAKKILERPIRNIVALGLAGLITITAAKDNVHFGSTTLHNPKENQYIWGIFPMTEIKGDAKGNIYTFGLIYGANAVDKNRNVEGSIWANGLLVGGNEVGDNSKINEGMYANGLLVGGNEVGDNSKINEGMYANGLLVGGNEAGDNSVISGDVVSRGVIASTPLSWGLGSNKEVGLENYVHKIEQKNK